MNCDICGFEMKGAQVGNGDGTGQRFAHPSCYWRRRCGIAEQPGRGLTRIRHKKRGTTYEILGEAQLQTDFALCDMAKVVVYRCEVTGELWVRRTAEMRDGRFENVL